MDYYQVLNVNRDASEEDIRKSYKKLALLYHPDKNQNNPEACEKFKEISEAYSILSDKSKRSQYDLLGNVDNTFDGEDPFSVFNNIFQQHMSGFMNMRYDNDINLADIMGSIPGMPPGVFPFGNVHVRVHTFPTDMFQTNAFQEEEIMYNDMNNMNDMNNKHNMNKVKINLKGKPDNIIYNIDVSFADIYNEKMKKITILRERKKNGKYIEKKKKIEIPVYGKEIILEGEGHELKDYKERGDVVINIYNKKDKHFKRVNEYDMVTFKDLTIAEFYSPFIYEIVLPHGEVLKVQSEKMNNKKILIQKIKGKGLPYKNDNNEPSHGDLFVIYKIVLPDNFDDLKTLEKCEDTTDRIDSDYYVAYNCDFNDIFMNE
jgi:DnaJ-class molecular chaperone